MLCVQYLLCKKFEILFLKKMNYELCTHATTMDTIKYPFSIVMIENNKVISDICYVVELLPTCFRGSHSMHSWKPEKGLWFLQEPINEHFFSHTMTHSLQTEDEKGNQIKNLCT